MFRDENLDCNDTFMRATNTVSIKPTGSMNMTNTSKVLKKSTMIYGNIEKEEYLKKAAEAARIDRIKQVREQEKLISRHGTGKQYRDQVKQQ